REPRESAGAEGVVPLLDEALDAEVALEDVAELVEITHLVGRLGLAFFVLVAPAALELDGQHAERVRRVDVRARAIADVDASPGLQVQVAARAAIELDVGLVDPDLVADEDRRRREVFVDAEADDLFRLLDHE